MCAYVEDLNLNVRSAVFTCGHFGDCDLGIFSSAVYLKAGLFVIYTSNQFQL